MVWVSTIYLPYKSKEAIPDGFTVSVKQCEIKTIFPGWCVQRAKGSHMCHSRINTYKNLPKYKSNKKCVTLLTPQMNSLTTIITPQMNSLTTIITPQMNALTTILTPQINAQHHINCSLISTGCVGRGSRQPNPLTLYRTQGEGHAVS